MTTSTRWFQPSAQRVKRDPSPFSDLSKGRARFAGFKGQAQQRCVSGVTRLRSFGAGAATDATAAHLVPQSVSRFPQMVFQKSLGGHAGHLLAEQLPAIGAQRIAAALNVADCSRARVDQRCGRTLRETDSVPSGLYLRGRRAEAIVVSMCAHPSVRIPNLQEGT